MSTLKLIALTLSGWLVGAFGWIKWLYELREKRLERAAKEKAQAELVEIRRRATDSSPLFLVSEQRFNGILVPTNKPTESTHIAAGDSGLLCFMRDEVGRDMPAGMSVYLIVEHRGSDAYEIAMHIDGKAAGFIKVEANGSHQLYAIFYPYIPEHHGRVQTIEVGFLAANGVRDTHRYTTKHGFRTLKRIDPA